MAKYFLYPRGILSGYRDIVDNESNSLVEDNIIYVNGSSAVEDLWEHFKNSNDSNPDRLIACTIAAQWLRVTQGDFAGWLALQEQNQYLKQRTIDFLEDTLKYIETGRRVMSIYTWQHLLSDADIRITQGLRPTLVTEFARNDTTELLSKWLSHRDGLADMMISLRSLFGKEKPEFIPTTIPQHLARTMPLVKP